MSTAMAQVVDRLQYDWTFIAAFFDDPESSLSSFDLSDDERAALMARDARALQGLGIDEPDNVLSGAHSSTCF